MNRRSFLRFAPAAVMVGLYVDSEIDPVRRVQASSLPKPVRRVDTRPVFRVSDFVLSRPVRAYGGQPCRACGGTHAFYTHGCRPIAFTPHQMPPESFETVPATPDALPISVRIACPFEDPCDPHRHEDFRWE